MAINDNGDNGDSEPTGGCDGVVPAGGLMKCKLVFKFEKAQTNVRVQVSSVIGRAAYFRLVAK